MLLSILTVMSALESSVHSVDGRPFIGNSRRFTHNIEWNISNPMFDRSNTDHVIDVEVGDKLNILCPVWNTSDPSAYPEYHSLYMVTRDQYTSCRLNVDSPKTYRWIFGCSAPKRRNVFSLFVTPFSPHPFGFEFQPGQDYYVISPSSGFATGMKDVQGGLCQSMNMKMVIRVAGRSSEPKESEEKPVVVEESIVEGVGSAEKNQQTANTGIARPRPQRPFVGGRFRGENNNNNRFGASSNKGVDVKVFSIHEDGKDETIIDVEEKQDWRRKDGQKNIIPDVIERIFETRRGFNKARKEAEEEEENVISNHISSYGGSSDGYGGYVIDVITPQRRTDSYSSSSSSSFSIPACKTLTGVVALTSRLALILLLSLFLRRSHSS